jgi:hypothetical protein
LSLPFRETGFPFKKKKIVIGFGIHKTFLLLTNGPNMQHCLSMESLTSLVSSLFGPFVSDKKESISEYGPGAVFATFNFFLNL